MDQRQTGISLGERAKGLDERRQIFPRFYGPDGQHVPGHPVRQQHAPGSRAPANSATGLMTGPRRARRPHARVDHPDPVQPGTKRRDHLLCHRARVGMHPCPPPQGFPDQFGVGTGWRQAHLWEPQRGQIVNGHDRRRPPRRRDDEVGAMHDIGPADKELGGWEGPVRPGLAERPSRHRPVIDGDPGRDL